MRSMNAPVSEEMTLAMRMAAVTRSFPSGFGVGKVADQQGNGESDAGQQ